MTLEEATTDYWRMSSHLRSLPLSERPAFIMFTLAPTAARTPCQNRRRLLTRLVSETQEAATA